MKKLINYSNYTLEELLEDKQKTEQAIKWAKSYNFPYNTTANHLSLVNNQIAQLSK